MPFTLAPFEYLPDRESCALLVIDIQERLCSVMPEPVLPGMLRNTRILIETAREMNIPIVLSEQYPKGLGPTVSEVRAVLPEGQAPITKQVFSCCKEPGFEPVLFEDLAMKSFILCGMETHVCVLQTALDLLQRDRRVYVAADAVISRFKLNWKYGLNVMRQAGAVIGTTELFAFGLLGTSGTDEFKRIQKLIK